MDHSDLVGGNCFLIDCFPPGVRESPPVTLGGPRKTARNNDVSWGSWIRLFQISLGECEIAACISTYLEQEAGNKAHNQKGEKKLRRSGVRC